MHVFRWDLDKTYLDTDFHSVRSLIRTALEPASRKRTIPGAAALMRALTRVTPDSRVHIVSGSPTQMRPVLEEKLALDGVRFDELVLKDNLGNLRRGRLRAVRGQLGYKVPNLLQQRRGLGPGVRETLFGDDAEVDAVAYALYADAIAGRATEDDVARVLEAGGAYADSIRAARDALRQVARADAVEDIFIHLDRNTPPTAFSRLGPRVIPVFSWFQAAVLLWLRGRLDAEAVAEVARAAADEASLDERALAGLVQDLVRRGWLNVDDVWRLLDEATALGPARDAIRAAIGWLGPAPATARPAQVTDYVGFLRRDR